MTLGAIESGGAMVACSSIFTMIISKIKCYYKKPWCLCACIDKSEHELLKSESDKSDSEKSDDSKSIFKKKRWMPYLISNQLKPSNMMFPNLVINKLESYHLGQLF